MDEYSSKRTRIESVEHSYEFAQKEIKMMTFATPETKMLHIIYPVFRSRAKHEFSFRATFQCLPVHALRLTHVSTAMQTTWKYICCFGHIYEDRDLIIDHKDIYIYILI